MSVDFAKLHILLIDDEPFMQNLIHRVLSEIGIKHVATAADGAEALVVLKSLDYGFDLIVCDLEMPNMDGLAFVKELRSRTKEMEEKIPVLIVTGHSEPENVKGAVAAGIHGYLVKPISKQALEKRIVAALSARQIDPNRFNK